MENDSTFFDFAAEVGLTKHIGGIEATKTLLEMCDISADKYVLDVGCGAGVTPAFIAKEYGCRVVGVDILEKMIERSREWALKKGASELTEFRVADAVDLPFENDLFDIVITESVAALTGDKHKTVNEFVRVTKPGGYVGLNETTWLKYPPPQDVIEWAAQDVGSTVAPLTPEEWENLLHSVNLKDVIIKTYSINVKDEAKGILQRYGLLEMIRVIARQRRLHRKSQAYRDFLKSIKERGIVPKNLAEYFGYGFFVGRK